MYRTVVFIGFFFVLSCIQLQATAKTYNLLEIFILSSKNSRQLQIADLKEYQAKENTRYARSSLLPQVEIEATETRTDRFAVYDENSQIIDYAVRKAEGQLSVSQVVYNPGLYRKYQQFKQEETIQQLNRELGTQTLMLTVIELYFSFLKAKDNLKILETKLDSLHAYENSAKLRQNRGLGTVTDHLETQIESQKTELEKTSIEQTIESIRNQLLKITGIRIDSLALLEEKQSLDLNIDDAGEWIQNIFQQNPEIKVKQAESELTQAEIKTLNAEWLPTVDFSYSYLLSDLPEAEPEETYKLTLSIPVFGGFSSTASRDEKLLEKEIQQKQMEELKLDLENRLLDTWFETKKTIDRIKTNRLLADLSKTVRDQTSKQMKSGVKTVVELIESENRHHEILLDLNNSYYDFLINKARLYSYSGILSYPIIEEFNQLLFKKDE